MIERTMTIAVLLGMLAAAACSSHPDPIIDMKGVNPVAMQNDWDECEAYSDEVVVARSVLK